MCKVRHCVLFIMFLLSKFRLRIDPASGPTGLASPALFRPKLRIPCFRRMHRSDGVKNGLLSRKKLCKTADNRQNQLTTVLSVQ